MSFEKNLNRIANSDAWLNDIHSDSSISSDAESSEVNKKEKPSYSWPPVKSNRTFQSEDEDGDDDADDTDDLADDDTDDEDWVECDKKRIQRSAAQRHSQHSFKSLAGKGSTQQSRERIRHKPSSSFPKPPHQQSQDSCGISRPNRISSQGFKPHGRVKTSSIDRIQTSKSRKDERRSMLSSLPRVTMPVELTEPRQCFGPGCTRTAARPDTKYCSEECGLRLALRRLEVLLPEQLQRTMSTTPESDVVESRNLEPIATRLDRARLEEIQNEKTAVRDRLVQLELDHQALTDLITCARERQPDMLAEVANEADQVEQMEPIVCVTCASEVSMRHALRHMEKCFQKMEGNSVFCANQKEQVVGTPLFCDTYDTQAKAYCKRLRVVCEHYKENKVPPDAVCGFPLVKDVFVENGSFCCVPRNKCTKHLGWERLRRASIDIERYRCFIKMDDLLQEEQRIHQAILQRGGLLGVLLHRTIDHKPSEPVPLPADLKLSDS